MKIMSCPLNGPLNISEFVYGGELKPMPDIAHCSDKEWADYVFHSENRAGLVIEWWMHSASAYWFLAERNTATDEIPMRARELAGARNNTLRHRTANRET